MILQQPQKMIRKRTRGFALLFAVLTASVLVALGISIYNISIKELQIATTEQQSQQAYYAADSAEECALYWDIKHGAFQTYIDSKGDLSTTTDDTIICNSIFIPLATMKQSESYPIVAYATSTFFQYTPGINSIDPEASISVTKTFCSAGDSTAPCLNYAQDTIQTVVEAQGHNTAIIGRRIERGVSQSYNN